MNMEKLVQAKLREVFLDPSLIYDKSHFAGGLTNYNYIMTIQGAQYVIRQPGIMTDRMISRSMEQVNNIIASDLGINSECVFFDAKSGIKISRYIAEAKTFARLNPCSPECLRAVAALLKTTHASPKPFPNEFNWRTELEKYEQLITGLNGRIFSDYPSLKAQMFNLWDDNHLVMEPVPCHNDTVPENFLMDVASGRPYLIDWEYSGMNDPALDLASYMAESHLNGAAIDELLHTYFGSVGPTAQELLKIKYFVLGQDLLWAIWALIRHYSGEDFLDYCYNRYNRFRKNLKLLTHSSDTPLSTLVDW